MPDWVKGFSRIVRPKPWDPEIVALVVLAVAIGGIASNLLATMIAEEGWVGAFERNPVRATVYAALVVGCALTTTVVVLK